MVSPRQFGLPAWLLALFSMLPVTGHAAGNAASFPAPSLDDARLATLIAYGRAVASIGPGERAGKAVLLSESGTRRILDVVLLDGGVSFSFG